MKREYGIPVPRGVPADWEATSVGTRGAGEVLAARFMVPGTWGDPSNCVEWSDRFDRTRCLVAHYPNGRSATVRIDANGNWKTLFGDVG